MVKGRLLTNSYCDIIQEWLDSNPGTYVEIGVFDGVFISRLAERYPTQRIVGIDPYISDGNTGQPRGSILQEQYENTLHNISPFNNVELYKHTTAECFSMEIYNKLANVSCVLIDGSHHYEDVLIDFAFVNRLRFSNRLLLVIDDIQNTDVERAVKYLVNSDTTEYSNITNNIKSQSRHHLHYIITLDKS